MSSKLKIDKNINVLIFNNLQTFLRWIRFYAHFYKRFESSRKDAKKKLNFVA